MNTDLEQAFKDMHREVVGLREKLEKTRKVLYSVQDLKSPYEVGLAIKKALEILEK